LLAAYQRGGGVSIRSEERPRTAWWTPRWWAQDARWLALAAVALIFFGHVLYGAMLPKTALTLALSASVLLLGALANAQVRRELGRTRDLALPGALFALVGVVVLVSLTPFAPGGPHPVWAYADAGAGAATLDKSQTLLEFIKLMGLGVVFLLGLAVGSADSRARAAVQVVLAAGAALALWSFVDWARGDLSQGIGRIRLGAPFQAANTAATLFGALLLLALGTGASALRSARPRERLGAAAPYAGASLLFLFCLLATASRGGLAATAAAILAFVGLQAFAGRAKWTRAALLTLAGLTVLGTAIFLGGDLLVERFLSDDLDRNGRGQLFAAHWSAFKGAPWMGYGLGSFDTVNRLILDTTNLKDLWSARAAHSVYLTWLEQAGIVGAAPMFMSIAVTIWLTVRATLRRSRLTSVLYGLIAVNVVFLVHGAADFALETYSMAAFWSLLLGLQFAASQGSARR
jgi:O-antigen ligase